MSLRDQAGASAASQQDESQIDLTPMLDVVFIMLIFFIVTSSFVKEPGVEIDKPGAATTEACPNGTIILQWMIKVKSTTTKTKVNLSVLAF